MAPHRPYLAMTALAFVQVLFGVNFVTSKMVVGVISPAAFACARFAIAGAVLYVIAARIDKTWIPRVSGWRAWGLLVTLAVVGTALSQSLFLSGLRLSTSTNAAILGTSIPVFTMLIVWARRQSVLSWREWLGMLIGFGALMGFHDVTRFSIDDAAVVGDALVLAGCFLMALHISLSKDLFARVPLVWGTSLLFLIAAAALVPFATRDFAASVALVNGPFVAAFAYSVLGATLVTYFLNNWAYRHVSPSLISLFIYLQPVVAFVVATEFMGETVSTRKIVCGVVIFAGMFLAGSSALKIPSVIKKRHH